MNSNVYFKLWCKFARNFLAKEMPAMELRVSHNREFDMSPELLGIHANGMDGTMIMSRSSFLKQFGPDQVKEPAKIRDYINFTGGFTDLELRFSFDESLNTYAGYDFTNQPFSRAKGTMVALRKALSRTEKGLACIKEIDRLTSLEIKQANKPAVIETLRQFTDEVRKTA